MLTGPKKWPHLEVVAALVEARRRDGSIEMAGTHGVGAWQAVRLGLAEATSGRAELNLRGQDIADEALALVKPMLFVTSKGQRLWLGPRPERKSL